VCSALPLRWSPCGTGGACRRGSYCHPETNVCTALPDVGEACTSDGTCRSDRCDAEGSCVFAEPLICDAGTCRDEPNEGYPCLSDGTCHGSYCANGSCAPWPAEGESCAPAGCNVGQYCAEGVCRALPNAGEECTPDGACREGNYCLLDHCEPLPAEGEPCLDGETCAQGFKCASDGACHQSLQLDDPCQGSLVPCPSDAYCSMNVGVCRLKPEAGGRCEEFGEGACPAGGPYCLEGTCRGCTLDYEQDVCPDGQFCRLGGCVSGMPAGFQHACFRDVNCEGTAYCSMIEGRCRSLPGPGQVCVEGERLSLEPPSEAPHGSCAAGLHCRNVEGCTGLDMSQPDCVCDPDPVEGESCEEFPCADGLYCVGGVHDGICHG
jgi:hypothetical protein